MAYVRYVYTYVLTCVMGRRLTASKLRQDIYRVLDRVLATGRPVEIERRGQILRIVRVADEPGPKLQRIRTDPGVLTGDPDDIVHMDWSGEWRP